MGTTRLIVAMTALAVIALALLTSVPAQAAADVHGFMLNRAYATPGPARFEAERVGLASDAKLDEDVSIHVEFYYHWWLPDNKVDTITSTHLDYDGDPIQYNIATTYNRLWLETAYADFTDKEGGRLRVGKSRNFAFGITPTYGNRKTTEYGLISETVTMDRIVGVQYNRPCGDDAEWGVALYNGLGLQARLSVGDANYFRLKDRTDEPVAVPHFADKGENASLEASARYAREVSPGTTVGLSARHGKITTDELESVIQGTYGLTGATSRTKRRYGLDITHKTPNGGLFQVEYYDAETSDLDHKAWCVLVGREPADRMAPRFYVRYGTLGLDVTPTPHPLTWDQKQLMISIVKPLRKATWLQLEYIKNDESPPSGIADVDNDTLFLELFNGW